MSNWRDDELAASFKGVPFIAVKDSQPFGQRTQVHEFPQQDLPHVEALGKRTKEIKISGFVAGDDFIAKRDALLAVIEEPGAGELIHPWFGSLFVSVTDCSVSHDRQKKGVTFFELVFVEGRSDPDYPTASADAVAILNGAADALEKTGIERFLEAIESIDLTQLREAAIFEPLNQTLSVLRDVYKTADRVFSSVTAVIDAVVSGPKAFANSLFSLVRGSESVFDGFYQRGKDVVSIFSLGDRVDSVNRVGAIYSPDSGVNGVFVSSIKNLVQDAIAVDVVKSISKLPSESTVTTGKKVAVETMPKVVETTMGQADQLVGELLGQEEIRPPVADDVLHIRDQLGATLWRIAESSPAEHYISIAQARTESVRFLTKVARQGTKLEIAKNNRVTPALVVAYRRYGNADHVSELVARNSVRHPGFVPVSDLLLPRR
jgi:prophage DNA circulation protein